jgi:hypothetical protein
MWSVRPSVLAPGSTLGARPRVALSSAQIVVHGSNTETKRRQTSTRLRDFRLWMVLRSNILPESHSRAIENYPQSCRAAQVVRLSGSTLGRSADQDRDRDSVRAAVTDFGLLCVRHAARGMSTVRCESGASTLVRWQAPIDDDLPLVPGRLGQANVLAERGRSVRYDLAERVSLGKTRGQHGVWSTAT